MTQITWIDQENIRFFKDFLPAECEQSEILLGAIMDDKAVGVLAADLLREAEEPTIMIRFLYVAARYRRKGAGTAMAQHLFTRAAEVGGAFVMLECMVKPKDVKLPGFFESLGFAAGNEEMQILSYAASDLSDAYLQKEKRLLDEKSKAGAGRVEPLSRVSEEDLAILRERMEEKGNALPRMHEYDRQLSVVFYEGETPAGCMLFLKQEKTYLLKYLGLATQKPLFAIRFLICAAGLRMKKSAPDMRVVTCIDRPGSRVLIERAVAGEIKEEGVSRLYMREL